MSFVSKNLQQTTNAMSFIKGATLFFLGMSVVLFLTQAFDIVPVATEVKWYFKTIILTSNGSNTAATGIELDGDLGRGHFVGNVDVDLSVNANTVNATTINGTTVNGTTVKGTMISWATVRGTTVCVNGECRTSRPQPAGSDTTLQFKAGTGFSGSDNLVRDNANGRLGIRIGIFPPTEVLDVNGTGKFTSVQIGTTMSLLSSSSYGVIQSATWLAFNTSGSSTWKMVIDTAGNVGIGINTPQTKLQIGAFAWIGKDNSCTTGSSDNKWSFLRVTWAGWTQCGFWLPPTYSKHSPNIQLNRVKPNVKPNALYYNRMIDGTENLIIKLSTGSTSQNYIDLLNITSDGNVGIGTGDPQAKLEVNGLLKVGSYDTSVANPCSWSSTEWAIFYSDDLNYHCVCDGTWASSHALHDINNHCSF